MDPVDRDDAELGRAVKGLARKLQDDRGDKAAWVEAACSVLIRCAHDLGSYQLNHKAQGQRVDGQGIGDWEVVVRRTDYERRAPALRQAQGDRRTAGGSMARDDGAVDDYLFDDGNAI